MSGGGEGGKEGGREGETRVGVGFENAMERKEELRFSVGILNSFDKGKHTPHIYTPSPSPRPKINK
jgi:hypothetical protein